MVESLGGVPWRRQLQIPMAESIADFHCGAYGGVSWRRQLRSCLAVSPGGVPWP